MRESKKDRDANKWANGFDRPGGHLYELKLEGELRDSDREFSNLEGAIIEKCTFDAQNMSHSNLKNAKIIGSELTNVSLDRSDMDGIEITSSTVNGCAHNALMRNARIKDSDLCRLELYGASAAGALFEDTRLNSANLDNCDFSGAVFRRCCLDSACAGGTGRARLVDAEFIDCDLRNVRFQATNLTRAQFAGSNLTDINLNRTLLDFADFSGCDMTGAHIKESFARNVNFRAAVLTGADLQCAMFTGANFTGANLDDANLLRADFRGATLDGVSLNRARYSETTQWPDGFSPPQTAIDSDRASDAVDAASSTVYERTGSSAFPVFIDAPSPTLKFDVIYAIYPEFFTVIDRWAFAENLGWTVYRVLEHAMHTIRVSDGTMPYETDNDKLYCLIYHLQNAMSAAQISASADTLGQSRETRVKDDKHLMYVYKRLQDEIAAARRKSAKGSKKQTRAQAAQ